MPRSRPSRRRSPFPGLILFLCGAVVGAAALLYFGWRYTDHRGGSAPPEESREPAVSRPSETPRRFSPHGRRGAPQRQGSSSPAPASSRPDSDPRSSDRRSAAPAADERARAASTEGSPSGAAAVDGVRVAVVIDDLGRSVDEVETLERLGVPLTYSVLPFEAATPEVVAVLRRHGDEILCHLPMEPVNGQNPGPGALRHGMDAGELRAATAAALAAVPGAVGANNHMGSRLSADPRSMHAVLGLLADRDLFFLDSRTSPESVGYRVATELGVPAAERQVFLDGDQRPQMIREQFERMLAIARQRGAAIAIGHPHAATLAALAAAVPRAKALGYRFVRVSDLLDRPAPAR
jgi:polysaccharide deacetylase 2 family uncharacterized protein YibQ